MNRLSKHSRAAALALVAVLVFASPAASVPIGYGFTYQGYLGDSGVPATGVYDLRFSMFDAASGGSQFGGLIPLDDVLANNGVFTAELDFGLLSFYFADAHWLQIEVRPGGSTGAYTTLPRQKLTPSPFAIGLNLPYTQATNTTGSVFSLLNQGNGVNSVAGDFTSQGKYGVVGRSNSAIGLAAGVRGEGNATTGATIGVEGIATNSTGGTGVMGTGASIGGYLSGTGPTSTGVFAYGYQRALYAENLGNSNAILAKGKGKTASDAVLRVENTETDRGMCAYFINHSDYATTHFLNDGTGEILYLEHQGTGFYIMATGPTGPKFWVDNAGTTHTNVLEIAGGSDLSERFDLADGAKVPQGSVVCIDPDHEGRLALSRECYDPRVAGIVSGAGGVRSGMVMGQQGSVADGSLPVALTGRVYVRATAANGPIRPGDLLTTSNLPGHAMRVSDSERARGATLGKAMGTLERGEGLVLVLVGLQ